MQPLTPLERSHLVRLRGKRHPSAPSDDREDGLLFDSPSPRRLSLAAPPRFGGWQEDVERIACGDQSDFLATSLDNHTNLSYFRSDALISNVVALLGPRDVLGALAYVTQHQDSAPHTLGTDSALYFTINPSCLACFQSSEADFSCICVASLSGSLTQAFSAHPFCTLTASCGLVQLFGGSGGVEITADNVVRPLCVLPASLQSVHCGSRDASVCSLMCGLAGVNPTLQRRWGLLDLGWQVSDQTGEDSIEPQLPSWLLETLDWLALLQVCAL
jgi:hypothetical protein